MRDSFVLTWLGPEPFSIPIFQNLTFHGSFFPGLHCRIFSGIYLYIFFLDPSGLKDVTERIRGQIIIGSNILSRYRYITMEDASMESRVEVRIFFK